MRIFSSPPRPQPTSWGFFMPYHAFSVWSSRTQGGSAGWLSWGLASRIEGQARYCRL